MSRKKHPKLALPIKVILIDDTPMESFKNEFVIQLPCVSLIHQDSNIERALKKIDNGDYNCVVLDMEIDTALEEGLAVAKLLVSNKQIACCFYSAHIDAKMEKRINEICPYTCISKADPDKWEEFRNFLRMNFKTKNCQ